MGTRSRSGADRHRTARPPCALVAVGATLLLLGAVSAARVVGDSSSTRAARPAPAIATDHTDAPTLTATAPAPATVVDRAAEPKVVLYGDSLSAEAQGYFAEFLIRNGITDVQRRRSVAPRSATTSARCARTRRCSTPPPS